LASVLAAAFIGACGGTDPAPAPASDTSAENPTVDVVAIETPTESAAAIVAEPTGAVATGEAMTFVIDPSASTATYAVDEEFLSGALERLGKQAGQVVTTGSTSAVSGEMTLDMTGPEPAASGEFAVDISTLQSDSGGRDRRIREQWLESASYPTARFTITGVEGLATTYAPGETVTFSLLGDLTIRDVTQPTTLDVTASLDGNTLTGTATTGILMTDFGFEPPNMLNLFQVGNEVDLTIEFKMTSAGA
jgi:polyisoprenoid-binding protein YceI